MGVAIEGELDAGVPGEVLDALRVRALRKQDCQASLTEIVPAYIGQTGTLEQRLEVAVEDVLCV